ncbi:hypothetical protein [Mucilaginibacter gynuensis]|uniref:hypothetical protein n=1 Tax=Mucilaginibacter gynuensis TaxID=1302236 RepID=UPI0031EE78B5
MKTSTKKPSKLVTTIFSAFKNVHDGQPASLETDPTNTVTPTLTTTTHFHAK